MFLKKGQIFQKGWTTSTPAVTDGWVFQKILLLKLAGDSLFSCFWQELGFSVKDNNGQIFLPAFYFYVKVLIVLVKETVTPVIHWFTLTVLESHVTDSSQSLIPGSDPPVTAKLFRSSAWTQGCSVWCGGQSSGVCCFQTGFLGFSFRFPREGSLLRNLIWVLNTRSPVGECLHLWLLTGRIGSERQAVFLCSWTCRK